MGSLSKIKYEQFDLVGTYAVRTYDDIDALWKGASRSFGEDDIDEGKRISLYNGKGFMHYKKNDETEIQVLEFLKVRGDYYWTNPNGEINKWNNNTISSDTYTFQIYTPIIKENSGGAAKSYVVYNGHRYVVRTGDKNTRFIQTKQGKVPLSKLKGKVAVLAKK